MTQGLSQAVSIFHAVSVFAPPPSRDSGKTPNRLRLDSEVHPESERAAQIELRL